MAAINDGAGGRRRTGMGRHGSASLAILQLFLPSGLSCRMPIPLSSGLAKKACHTASHQGKLQGKGVIVAE
ncbi:hypothetical protein [Janthinobacterium sp. NKUCC08_JDC]|uniref:hypothetical protein n=1 Tax=Janthinobacterium sp. NKUCC08_JDC TaxID=2842122 RepID=UPI001C5AA24D|nr:hypothetical protein [Janthinobacterium sp. NKUCC08_JDC]MBW3501017.1 hypothetical protein [Janthinobacterium sp. NKUCC08_JDC]